ncbi:CIA30 family protein [Pseudomassariella vexata]|uniref:CIA30 family protein n=1 Tax=Pseudomassariella vexata TaxID=1141098 RepID=A0A1Y2DPW1_9PEZI|nr:CIA30 family protein [Pseudomassariella vexata]ORY61331.1 CIA30 family protein [Pseudomassariella vexata]
MTSARQHRYLFGGPTPWSEVEWTSSDDRVRGGKSQSYLDCSSITTALFHGNLDITALGGAGFASQRTATTQSWNLTDYHGLSIHTGKSDGKKYTLTLKDETLPKRPDGREQSTVSWEYDFVPNCNHGELFVPWDDFKPTYRGRPKADAPALDLANVRRISLMMRSFFGSQHGEFRLEIDCIAASTTSRSHQASSLISSSGDSLSSMDDLKGEKDTKRPVKSSWFGWMCGFFK